MSLKLAWIDYKSAEKAVIRYHYSRKMPRGKLAKIGVWEDKIFIGAVIYGRGASPKVLSKHAGLDDNRHFVELCRVALNKHKNHVSKIIAISIKLLKKQNPNLKAIVSFADTKQGHLGKIYQAGNWDYVGLGAKSSESYVIYGKMTHKKTMDRHQKKHQKLRKEGFVGSFKDYLIEYVDPNIRIVKGSLKHKYIYCLEKETKQFVSKFKKPYPTTNADIVY
tara:strand:- start:948 stop:1610 length:663 start_codon:yes stop_codon:yes gene_type:complete